ncbi:MAG: NAD(P)-binding domain-containing protein [Octadecabacter sp.]|nr:NAD(P)-binding domain-containing protein [Octadecabacter sp.]
MTHMIPFEDGQIGLDWLALTDALADGHSRTKAKVEDVFMYRDGDTLLNRSAWIEGMGLAIKCATIFPSNKAAGDPMVNGAVNLFSDDNGQLEAILDFHLVTKWKTAADSLLAARRLARPNSKRILIVGAGIVGRSLWQAYSAAFPQAKFFIWNRSPEGAQQFVKDCDGVTVTTDLEAAVRDADIVTSATMATEPLLKGAWFQPGQHIDLIGAYRPDMREVDDEALLRTRVFVDSYATTMKHIGELKIPLEAGVISPDHIVADYYALDMFQRRSEDEITLFKNGGGAHLDLMTSCYIMDVWKGR